jgi:hypothetical protein
MKNLFAAAAFLAVGTVGAQELKYGDLNYFYKKGQLDAGVVIDLINDKQVADLGTNKFKVYSFGYIGSAKATYGLMDKLNVFAQTEYAYEFNSDNGAGGRSFNSDGVRNVGVGADYRIYNQNDHLFNLDVGAVVRVATEDAIRGTNIGAFKDGNFAEVSDSVELRLKAGRKWDLANEVFLLAGVIYNGEGSAIQRGATDASIDYDSSIDYKLSANYQWRPVNEFMTGFGVGATYFGDRETNSANILFKGTQESHLDLNFNFAAKYLVTDHMIVSLNIMNARLADYDNAGISMVQRHSFVYGFGVNYLFD